MNDCKLCNVQTHCFIFCKGWRHKIKSNHINKLQVPQNIPVVLLASVDCVFTACSLCRSINHSNYVILEPQGDSSKRQWQRWIQQAAPLFPRGILHSLHIPLKHVFNWILVVIMHSTGSLEGLVVETILKWKFLFVQFDIYGHFSAQKESYFIKAPKVTGQTDFLQS